MMLIASTHNFMYVPHSKGLRLATVYKDMNSCIRLALSVELHVCRMNRKSIIRYSVYHKLRGN